MRSRRFPGKMIQELCGQPLIKFVINRAKRINNLNCLVVATTRRPVDDIIAEMAKQCQVNVYRGRTDDVVSRFLACAQEYNGDYFVRLNGDSPCIDTELVEEGIRLCLEGYDIISNLPSRTFPYGISLEIVKTETFNKSYPQMNKYEREHITSYFYRNKENFRLKEITNNASVRPDFRFTIDVPEDLERLNRFLGNNPDRSWREVK